MKWKIFGFILIFLGISVIGTALGMRYYGEYKQKKMMNDFEKSIEKDNPGSDTSQTQNQGQSTDKSPDNKPPSDSGGAIGIMTIPKIDLKVAIGEGVDMQTLKYAVGHFPGTAMPGKKGNFCVAGHRSYTYSEYFNRLDEVTIGDTILVRTKDGEFKYVVYNKQVVEPSEYSVLNPTSDATLTLVTCTPIRIATHRLIIKARLQG